MRVFGTCVLLGSLLVVGCGESPSTPVTTKPVAEEWPLLQEVVDITYGVQQSVSSGGSLGPGDIAAIKAVAEKFNAAPVPAAYEAKFGKNIVELKADMAKLIEGGPKAAGATALVDKIAGSAAGMIGGI